MSVPLYGLWFHKLWMVTIRTYPVPSLKPLRLAAFNGHQEAVRVLLEKGSEEIDKVDGSERSALQWVCTRGHIKIVQQLLEKVANVAQDRVYGNALQAAAAGGYSEVVQQLLENGADVNAHGGKYGNALQATSAKGYIEIMQELLEHGADVNAPGEEYGNALQPACAEG